MDLFRREIHGWHSPRLNMYMPLVQYGHWGHPLLLLPTAQADHLEYERYGLIDAVRHHLEAGRVRIFSVDSINNHAWMNSWVSYPEKSARQAAFSAYIEEELVPHIRDCVKDESARIGVAGASFGAFHAANLFFRRPDLFDCLVGMSGFYDLSWLLHGYSDENVYFNNPMWFVANMTDHAQLETLRNHSQIHLVSGQGDWEVPGASQRFSTLLWSKGIPHNLDLWGRDIPHEWWSWHRMLDHYLGQRLGW
ncbi:MAG TPA: hypothetical protein DFS52_31730 [Myxococcales bacterium]|jgi:esterase/lipase superfamily enzyme|nr:hypothetical protein [Myxococcales bacterium]